MDNGEIHFPENENIYIRKFPLLHGGDMTLLKWIYLPTPNRVKSA